MTDHDDLIEVKTMVRDIHTAVMGNGKPGLLDDVAHLKTKVAGVLTAIVVLTPVVGAGLIYALTH